MARTPTGGFYQRKVNRRKRLRPELARASSDVKWYHMCDWRRHELASHQEIADRLGMSRGAIIEALKHDVPPSMRKGAVAPAMPSETRRLIERRRSIVSKIADVVEGTGTKARAKFPTSDLIAKEMQRRLGTQARWHPSTVYRDLIALDYVSKIRPLTGKARGQYDSKSRAECCHNLLAAIDVDWLIFSDEKWFDTNDHGQRCSRGERKREEGCTDVERVEGLGEHPSVGA